MWGQDIGRCLHMAAPLAPQSLGNAAEGSPVAKSPDGSPPLPHHTGDVSLSGRLHPHAPPQMGLTAVHGMARWAQGLRVG
eukprot:CAMPEP_0195107382 /NCGR_PEP_ID=MMETSP0448-20130528/82051_1 /TAXON_ID=66468 /ORGANISM="Heterocapsa triquestra, Strain CCMP 448" /LENGTH=79 /DNA_ID=CAMNT_0040143815 /DNA_START=14 /DNA_END=251 /DNA_ORIENTATION=+